MSRLSLTIAFRYFFSRKSQRVINIISMISAIGVTIGTAALIIVLSVFNGFEDLVMRLYNSFDPDLRITLVEGKTFSEDKINLDQLKKINGVEFVNPVIEESALARYRDKQYIIKLKGVSDEFQKMTGLDTMIVDGEFLLKNGDINYALVGGGIAYNLGINPANKYDQIEIYGPRSGDVSALDPEGAFNRRYITASGVFAVQQEFDSKYIIAPIEFVRNVFDYQHKLTSVEIGLRKDSNQDEVIKQLGSILGNNFEIKNRYQQHQLIYKIMKSEKLAVFIILTFILIIAIFNVISSLTMLVIEKKKDIAILKSMGAETTLLRKIFLTEGMFITFFGAVAGLLIGWIVCFLQETFGLIELSGSGSFVIDAYPVKIVWVDFLYVFITVSCIGLIAAWYPAQRLIREKVELKLITGDE